MANKLAPLVTGISPAEGPPGTTVKIRGENLGKDSKDLIGVLICNVNCTYTAEWTPHYITCRTGLGLGMGDIVVYTKSGGQGSSTVTFRGFMPRVGLLTESAVWVDESKLFEDKPSSGGGLSLSRSLSPSYLNSDPLGVAPEETGAHIPADKLDEMYPKCSGNPLQENFHPARFLLEKHLDTTFDALKSGFYHLESQDTRKSTGPSSFVRGNLGTILESLDTLRAVQKLKLEDESNSLGGSICEELEGILKSCNAASHTMFNDILKRKDEADAKRNALNVLQRFKFLFNLQRSIEKNIQQGDYEIVISDYNRAKALFQNTEVKSFQKVLREVDHRIATFASQLKEKLSKFPSTLDEQRRLIRYLTDLDYPGDPAWDCIQNMQKWIKTLFFNCKKEHQKHEKPSNLSLSPPTSSLDVRAARSDVRINVPTDYPLRHSRTPSDNVKNSNSQLGTPKKSHTRASSLPEVLSVNASADRSTPSRIEFLEELCNLMVENLPELWQLGQAYTSGQLGNKAMIVTEDQENISKRQNKFYDMIGEVIQLFYRMVQGVFSPTALAGLSDKEISQIAGWGDLQTPIVPWLPNCARNIRSSFDTLKALGLPSSSLSLLKQLTVDVCEQCVKEVLQATVRDIEKFQEREQWELEYSEANRCISKLPGIFKKMVTDSLLFVKEFMSDTKIDNKEQNLSLQMHVTDSLKKMIEAFLNCLKNAVAKIQNSLGNPERKIPMSGSASLRPTLKSSWHNKSNVELTAVLEVFTVSASSLNLRDLASPTNVDVTNDQKLLIILSNVSYIKDTLLPKLIDISARNGFEDLKNHQEIFIGKIDSLDNQIFDIYIEHKSEPLVGSIEQGMYLGEYRWEDDLVVTGVRPYVREIIMSLVVIHNEVGSICSDFVQRVFQRIGLLLADELRRIIETYPDFSSNGALQANLEVKAFEECLQFTLTEDAKDSFRVVKERLGTPSEDKLSVFQDKVSDFQKEMFFQLSCFWPDEQVSSFLEKFQEMAVDLKEDIKPQTEIVSDTTPQCEIVEPKPRSRSINVDSNKPPPKKRRAPAAPTTPSDKPPGKPARGKAPSTPSDEAPGKPVRRQLSSTPPDQPPVKPAKGKAPTPPSDQPPGKPARGKTETPKKPRAPSPPKTLIQVAAANESNPFFDDSDEDTMEQNTPFEDVSSPFADESNPPANESNPFLDDSDEDIAEQNTNADKGTNPFLDDDW